MTETLTRGWLAVSFVQQIGLGVYHLQDPTSLVRTLTGNESSTVSTTLAGQIFSQVCVQVALVKAALLLSDTRAMHMLHAVSMIAQMLLASGSILLEGFHLLITKKAIVEDSDKPRPKRLIAKHYLESHVSDLNTGVRPKHD